MVRSIAGDLDIILTAELLYYFISCIRYAFVSLQPGNTYFVDFV